ncbi:MAG: TolC family protein [candidate division Zixibacteria bacterium]|nr:TolC family protein [candidate division Zixibacteria bacterium]
MAIRGFFRPALLFVFLSMPGAQSFGGPLALDSLIKKALDNNTNIIAAKYLHRSADFASKAAGALPDPQLTIAASNMPRSSLSFDQTPMSGKSIGFMQPIPWPGKLSAKSKLAHSIADVQSENVKIARNRVVRQVKESYYDYSYWVLATKLIDENIEISKDIIEFVETRYANGESSLEEVISSEIKSAELSNKKLQFESNQKSWLLRLGHLTNDSFIVSTEISALLPLEIDTVLPVGINAVTGNPSLARARFNINAAKNKESLARSKYLPDFKLGIDYRIRSDELTEPIGGEDFLSFKVGLSVPLWFFAKQKNEVRAKQQGLLAAQAEEKSISILLQQSIKDTQQQLGSLYNQAKQYQKTIIPLAEAAFEAAFAAHEVGQIDLKAVMDDQIILLNSRLAHLSLVKQFHQTQAVLDELSGKEYGE